MSVTVQPFGSTRAGEEVTAFTVTNAAGASAVLLDYGATVQSLFVPNRDGGLTDVVLGYDSVEEYEAGSAFIGATIGRVGNRIGGARFSLGGKEYALAKNDGENNLHSGPDGYHNRQWTAKEVTANRAVFCLDSPDGDQGYPGRLRVSVTYTLEDDDSVHIVYEGVSDADTVVNLTNHAYFNLNGHKAGTAMDHLLRINADAFTPVGQIIAVTPRIAPMLNMQLP